MTHNFKKILLIPTVMILSLLVGLVFYFVFFKSGINSGLEQLTAHATALYEQKLSSGAGFPIRLKIPKINVDVAIEYVGITKDGGMGVPTGPINVGWYKGGPRPGDVGSAVIDGHAGWKNGIFAAFDNLYKLKKGDKIYVEDEKGTVVTFIVQKIKEYNSQANASKVFTSSDGKAHLNLITCSGVWSVVKKSHSSRLVVFADKE